MARAEAVRGWARAARGIDPFLPLWRLLTSVRFALALIGFLALAGLLSVLLPQVPAAMKENPAAVEAWVEFQKGKFGPLTEPMYRWGLFDVFSARWFLGALALVVVSVCVCTANRFPPIWRNITRPQERVPDAFFDRAGNRATLRLASSGAGAQVEAALRRRRFRVRRFQEGATTYLFADRLAWAQLGTFVSHLALILFLAGGLVSRFGGYTQGLFIAEGATSPVFPVSHRNQMQVEVVDAIGRFDEKGTPVDYRTELVIYQGGQEVKRGVTTVNDPLSYGGYRFHQAGYFGEGAALRVRDAATGNTLYQEVLPLRGLMPAPELVVRDAAGRVLVDDVIVPTDVIEALADDGSTADCSTGGVCGAWIALPEDGREFWVGVRRDAEDWRLVVFGRGDPQAQFALDRGGARRLGDLEFAFADIVGLPETKTTGLPGDEAEARAIMSELPDGRPYLTVLGAVDGQALTLYPGESVNVNGNEYVFEGRREFAGIEVRRDPGANFIWVAAGLLLVGLMITFYLPRLRLWARERAGEVTVAGLAEKSGLFRSEMRQIARSLGATISDRRQESRTDA